MPSVVTLGTRYSYNNTGITIFSAIGAVVCVLPIKLTFPPV